MIRTDRQYMNEGRLTPEGLAVFAALERRLDRLEARIAAALAVAEATGGTVIDVEARAELAAIKAALA